MRKIYKRPIISIAESISLNAALCVTSGVGVDQYVSNSDDLDWAWQNNNQSKEYRFNAWED